MTRKISVFLIHDSDLVRHVTNDLLSRQPDIEIIGSAHDPLNAQKQLQALNPDVILLDIHMRRIDGLHFLKLLRHTTHIPVLMFSSLAEISSVKRLPNKIRAAALATQNPRRPTGLQRTTQLIAIGCSTGGPEALREILAALTPDLPPIVIVQHMPERFTRAFAKRLDALGSIRVSEAQNNQSLFAGQAYLAPGNQHLEIQQHDGQNRIRLSAGPLVNGHRPSVDVLFFSCAKSMAPHCIGVILTGMGHDGAKGLLAMRQAGAYTIAQNEASSVVFGMPREAIDASAVDTILPLSAIAPHLMDKQPPSAASQLERQ